MLQNYENTPPTRGVYRRGGYTYLLLFNLISFMKTAESIIINGEEYVKKGSESNAPAKSMKGKKYVIVRTYSAGVFAGYLDKKEGQNAIVLQARRLWYWKGSASLSELSVHGVSAPNECKFPCEVSSVELDQVIEVLPCTEKARLSIASVPIWSAK